MASGVGIAGNIGATRCSWSSGRPIQKSRPRGFAISSAKNLPMRFFAARWTSLADRPRHCDHVIAVARAGHPERRLLRDDARPCGPSRRRRRASAPRGCGARRRNGRAAWRPVAVSLPFWPNSGQYFVTGASRSSWPRSASMCAQSAMPPLVEEKTIEIVSLSHASPPGDLRPPQRSTTGLPSMLMAQLAPTSPRVSKLVTKASSTPENFGSQVPSTWPALVLTEIFCMSSYLDFLMQDDRAFHPRPQAGEVDPSTKRAALPASRPSEHLLAECGCTPWSTPIAAYALASSALAWTGPESLPFAVRSRSTNSITAMGALSPKRKPAFRTRV